MTNQRIIKNKFKYLWLRGEKDDDNTLRSYVPSVKWNMKGLILEYNRMATSEMRAALINEITLDLEGSHS